MSPRWKTRLLTGFALAAGLLLRGFFVLHHPRWGGDTFVYGDLATNMLRHHVFGFTERTIRPTLIRLPGYPAFLALCFSLFGQANYLAVVWVQVVLDLCSCVLLSRLAARLFGKRAGTMTLWLAALCPFTANYAAAALTETLSLFCVVLALFALERWTTTWSARQPSLRWTMTIGASLGLAVLVRPDQGLLAAAVVPAMLWHALRIPNWRAAQRLAPAAMASLVVMMPLLLWGLRNERVFHIFQPLAPRNANDPGEQVPFGFQRWYRTWGIDYKSTYDIYWNYDGAAMLLKDIPPRAFDTPFQRAATASLLDRYNVEQSGSSAFDAAFAKLAAERVVAHPVRYYLLLPIARDANMWLRPRTELLKLPLDWWNVRAHAGDSTFQMVYGLLNLAYLTLAGVGLYRWRRACWMPQPAVALAMVAFVVLRALLLLTLDNSEPRYTLEAFPIVILLAGYALIQRSSA